MHRPLACQLFFTLIARAVSFSAPRDTTRILSDQKNSPHVRPFPGCAPPEENRQSLVARATRAVRDPHANREAQRYARPIPSREAILALLEERGELLTEARIADALQIHD